MKAIWISTGVAALLLAGCNSGNEQQFVENGIRGQLSAQGNVTQISMTKQGDGNYTGTATVRTADGTEARVNCTANRDNNGFVTACRQTIDEALLTQLENSLRQNFTTQGVTVVDLQLSRQDDDHVTGHANLRNEAGAETRYPCTGARAASGQIEVRCLPPEGAAAPAQGEPSPAPAEGEDVPADEQ
jgi:hypothetical protein